MPRDREWLIFQDEARKVYQSDNGGRRVEWATAGHRAARAIVPILKTVKNEVGNFSASEASDAIRLFAEVLLALISVALHEDNPEDDPELSIPGGEG